MYLFYYKIIGLSFSKLVACALRTYLSLACWYGPETSGSGLGQTLTVMGLNSSLQACAGPGLGYYSGLGSNC